MGIKCNKCLYDCFTWCTKYESEIGCGTCERLDSEGRCKCLLVDARNCPDFTPKENTNEKLDEENQAVAE